LYVPAIAGVVDEHVEGTDGGDGRGDRGVVGHVELDEVGTQVRGGLGPGLGVAGGDPDVVALREQPAGGLEPEALVGSGDQGGGHGSTLLCRRRRSQVPVGPGCQVDGGAD
jgi:hypothetical protein